MPKYQYRRRSPNPASIESRVSRLERASQHDATGALSEAAVKRALRTGERFDQALEYIRGEKYKYARKPAEPKRKDCYMPGRGPMGLAVRYSAATGRLSEGSAEKSKKAIERALREGCGFNEALKLNALGK
jgi:hypothetical protein